MDPLAALPEAELRAQVLSQLSSDDKRAAALVCRTWRAAVGSLPVQRLRLTTDQVSQDAFIAWLRRPGRAEQVQDFSVASAQGCVGELCMPVAEVRRQLSSVTRYQDHVSQQVDRVIAELPACVEYLDVGTPASVAAARLELHRLTSLQSLVLAAGFFQEISGLPASLSSLRLHRNVVYVRLLGDLSKLEELEVPIYDQAQLAACCGLPGLKRLRLHLYAGVGLSLAALPRLSATLEHLELRAYGAAVTEAGTLAQLTGLKALSLDIDLSFFNASARTQEEALLESLRLPPSLRRLRIARFVDVDPLPMPLVRRIDALRPQLKQLHLSALPPGWHGVGDQDIWDLE